MHRAIAVSGERKRTILLVSGERLWGSAKSITGKHDCSLQMSLLTKA